MAASKDLIVSRGRSRRERVGFEASGSAYQKSVPLLSIVTTAIFTDDVAIHVFMLDRTQ